MKYKLKDMTVIYETLKTVFIDWEFIEKYYPKYKETEEYRIFFEYQKIIDGEKIKKTSETQKYLTSVEWCVGGPTYDDYFKEKVKKECKKRQAEIGLILYNKTIEFLKNK